MFDIAKKIFGTKNDRGIKSAYRLIVDKINALESQFEKLADDELKAKTSEFRSRLEKGETTQDILPEAFATVREGSKRGQNETLRCPVNRWYDSD